MKATAADSRLVFDTVSVSIKNKDILHGINGVANSGELLAVMGPTGSGKTTLLNVISGRIQITTGQVTLNGRPMTKALRRRIAYVLQDDFFLSNLTLYEPYVCNQTTAETYKVCETAEFLKRKDLLSSVGIDLPFHCYLSTMAILILLLKILGYYVLKWKKE